MASLGNQFNKLKLGVMSIGSGNSEKTVEKGISESVGDGHLGNLSQEEQAKLKDLWGLVLKMLSLKNLQEYLNEKVDKKKIVQMAEEALPSLELDEARIEGILNCPLAEELWSKFAVEHPDSLLLRFLRARKWNLTDAFVMFFEALKWSASNKVSRMHDGRVKKEIFDTKKGFIYGYDLLGRPVILILARNHNQYAHEVADNTVFLVNLMELALRVMRRDPETFCLNPDTVTVIFDLADAPVAAFDAGVVKFIVDCFQNYYPETLGHCYILNAPWIFWGFWKVVKMWLDPVVASKITFSNDPLDILGPVIDKKYLLKAYGGLPAYEYEMVGYEKCVEFKPLNKTFREDAKDELVDFLKATIDNRSDDRHEHIKRLMEKADWIESQNLPDHYFKRQDCVNADHTVDFDALLN